MAISRSDTSLLGRWWWSVDRWTLVAIATLIGFGYVMMLAASPAVAEHIHETRDSFIIKQVAFLMLAGVVVVCVSMLSPRNVRRLALVGCMIALGLTAMTLVVGVEIKGARRWIPLPGMSIQPSEFLKPCFAVVAAWLITEGRRRRFPGTLIACAIYAAIAALLLTQPDIGMLLVLSSVLFAQLFVGGLNLGLVGGGIVSMACAAVGIYYTKPHVRERIAHYLHPAKDAGPSQIDKALQAFGNGGLLGRGPGEGHVKDKLPDAHADFVFAVAGEEFGFLVCLVIISIFAFIVIRGLLKLLREHDMFVILAVSGLVTGFGLQALINMASSLDLIPTKGMTLPFISYGGSSAIAISLGMGMLLSLTRTRSHGDRP